MAFLRESSSIPSRSVQVVSTLHSLLLLYATVFELLENHSVLEGTIALEALGQLEDIDSPNLDHLIGLTQPRHVTDRYYIILHFISAVFSYHLESAAYFIAHAKMGASYIYL